MNNKVVLGLLALVVVVGAVLLLTNSAKNSQNNSATQQPSSGTMAKGETVSLTSSGFNPQSLTVKAGTTVTWVNNSGGPATVNSDDHPTHQKYPMLNLGKFEAGSSLQLKFDKPGTYTYHNHLNPSQKGTVVVQ